jgi:hypothetical protein
MEKFMEVMGWLGKSLAQWERVYGITEILGPTGFRFTLWNFPEENETFVDVNPVASISTTMQVR